MPLCHFDSFNLWILKPTHLNRGRGIHVFRDVETLNKLIKQYCSGRELETFKKKDKPAEEETAVDKPKDSTVEESPLPKKSFVAPKVKFNTFIIQKYIERPLLLNKRKFDIRIWVFLGHDSDIWFYPEGYLRTSGTEFGIDLKNVDDAFVHLTNNAV